MRKILKLILVLIMINCLVGCDDGEPVIFDAAPGAPYVGLYEIDKMNSSTNYSYNNGINNFVATINWKTKNENIDYAEFTAEYYLEYAFEENMPYELIEPIKDMLILRNKTYTIKPGEELELVFNIDDYFDELPTGFYKFVKIINVVYIDGTSQDEVICFNLEL